VAIDSYADAEHLKALREVLMTCVGIYVEIDEPYGDQPVLRVRNLQLAMRAHEEISVSGAVFVSGLGRKFGSVEDVDQAGRRIVADMREDE
jgi:hypothetical protein